MYVLEGGRCLLNSGVWNLYYTCTLKNPIFKMKHLHAWNLFYCKWTFLLYEEREKQKDRWQWMQRQMIFITFNVFSSILSLHIVIHVVIKLCVDTSMNIKWMSIYITPQILLAIFIIEGYMYSPQSIMKISVEMKQGSALHLSSNF